ncbi:MAG: hypothetical protein OEQ29_02440 [Alphaproteobacteria bacterium]|nr:hypothetical protein [Alphaproteobacteria bacterium]
MIGMFSADDVTDVVSAIMFDLTGLNAPNNVPLDTRTFLTVNGPWTFTGGPAGLTIPFSIGLDPTITAAVSVDGFARFTADLFGNYTFDVFDGPNAGGVGSDSGTYTVMQKVSTVPLPAALPLFGTVLGLMGLAGWWRRRRTQVAAA